MLFSLNEVSKYFSYKQTSLYIEPNLFFFPCCQFQLNTSTMCFNYVLFFSVNEILVHNEDEDGIRNTFADAQTHACVGTCVRTCVGQSLLH